MTDKKKYALLEFLQGAYITSSLYVKNNLDACASACSFGFIFSFMPIILLILTIFINILHVSSFAVQTIISLAEDLGAGFDVMKFIDTLSDGATLSFVNIVLGFFIVWMARKLFLSIVQGLAQIFKPVARARPIIKQLLTFAGVLIAVIVAAVMFFAAFTTRQIFSLPLFTYISENIGLPVLFSRLSNRLTNAALYVMLFILTVIAYKFATGSRPPFKLCVVFSGLCTISFYVFIAVISFFLNRANYNTIYGVLSNLVVLLFEVYIFFTLFLFFAQGIYTVQYFPSLLLTELYLLPRRDSPRIDHSLRRLFFILPSALMTEENTLRLNEGETVYSAGSIADSVYYVVSGSVKEVRGMTQSYRDKGMFFGEPEVLLNMERQGNAAAESPCTLLRIPSEDFSALIKKDAKASVKVMSKLAEFKA